MEEQNQEVQPRLSEYKGKPIIHIPTADPADIEATSRWMSFGKNKARAIVKYIEIIKKFAES
jgi:hypothetical protein